jgi:hypothetical protein
MGVGGGRWGRPVEAELLLPEEGVRSLGLLVHQLLHLWGFVFGLGCVHVFCGGLGEGVDECISGAVVSPFTLIRPTYHPM